jgi:site-specific DNA-methyltransferase (adenine-specific)
MEWMIRSYTNPGDIILDNVAGASTTLVAARNCGRRAIGIELHDDHIETSIARLESGAEGDRW